MFNPQNILQQNQTLDPLNTYYLQVLSLQQEFINNLLRNQGQFDFHQSQGLQNFGFVPINLMYNYQNYLPQNQQCDQFLQKNTNQSQPSMILDQTVPMIQNINQSRLSENSFEISETQFQEKKVKVQKQLKVEIVFQEKEKNLLVDDQKIQCQKNLEILTSTSIQENDETAKQKQQVSKKQSQTVMSNFSKQRKNQEEKEQKYNLRKLNEKPNQENSLKQEQKQVKLQRETKKIKKNQKMVRVGGGKRKVSNSKNILRIYQRAIFRYMKNNLEDCEKILGFPLSKIGPRKRQIMGNIQSIKELRDLWMGKNQDPFEQNLARFVRIMSLRFLKTQALPLFNNIKVPVKDILQYRSLLIKFLYEPSNFIALMV